MAETQAQKQAVSLNPKSFRDIPLCELCFEDALKVGARKSEELKPQDITETSVRFCIDGLGDWYSTYAEEHLDVSVHRVFRDIIWQWASFCETDATLSELRKAFNILRREIVEGTAYTDLVERMRKRVMVSGFGFPSSKPTHVTLPIEASGIISRVADTLGMDFSRFFQVGLAWSLSTNRSGLYSEWVSGVFRPLFDQVIAQAKLKVDDLDEVVAILAHRESKRFVAQTLHNAKNGQEFRE